MATTIFIPWTPAGDTGGGQKPADDLGRAQKGWRNASGDGVGALESEGISETSERQGKDERIQKEVRQMYIRSRDERETTK